MRPLQLIVFFLFAVCTATPSFAGNNDVEASPSDKASITGKITDKLSREELVCAIVEVEGTDIAVFTDINGTFKLENLKPGNYTLNVKYISYQETLVENIKVKGNKTRTLNIQLSPI